MWGHPAPCSFTGLGTPCPFTKVRPVFFFFSKKIYFYFMRTSVLPSHMPVPYKYLVSVEARRGAVESLRTGVTDNRKLLCGCWDSNQFLED